MPKKYSLSSIASKNILVIVESPSKCKKIEQYLGPGYKCVATFGHLRELSSLKNIDMEHQFKPTYTIIDKKREQIAMLQKEILLAKEVILFTDADREGEAIAWHCCELFKLSVERTKRITCNEITESGVQSAINQPRTINMRLVHAQQARQVLDLLVGFQVTPTLWKHFTRSHANSLSAGRCQTPALRIIYDNQQEIELVKERKVYNTVGYFTNLNLPFKLNKQWEEESEMTEYLWQTSEFSHVYTYDPPKKVSRSPPIPFSTSKLQQASSNDLRMSPKETMKVCQKLYEAGYITYMRTDSHKYSKEFIVSAKNYITKQYDLRYISDTIDDALGTSTLGGEAHEAIRPTNISLLLLPDNMESKERKMYKLIWENTLESCMAAATFHSLTARVEAAQRLEFNYTTNLVDFPGWKIVSKKQESEINPVNKEYYYLQSIKQTSPIGYIKVASTVTLANTTSHYSEAVLVQELESKGIGRPSTFASIVDKLLEREYVTKEDIVGTVIVCKDLELENNEVFEIETKREFGNEKNKLKLQPLGRMVIEFLLLHFNELFEYDFTKNMETRLDDLLLLEDPSSWPLLCKECNDLLSDLIKKVSPDKMSVTIDDTHSYMIGKYGPVVKCSENKNGNESVCFKGIHKDTDIQKLLSGQLNLTDVLKESSREKSYILGKHDLDDIILKKGKYGLYLTWGKKTKNLKELGNRPIESIKYEDIEKYLEQGSNIVREISSSISIRKGAKGHYLFYKTLKMKQPTFHSLQGFKQDHEKCDVYAIKLWLKDTYNIS